METTIVDISGLDKLELLMALHEKQKVAGFFGATAFAPRFDRDQAHDAIQGGYIDYFSGRAIKADISGDTADTRLYDRDAGHGAFAGVVARLRSHK